MKGIKRGKNIRKVKVIKWEGDKRRLIAIIKKREKAG